MFRIVPRGTRARVRAYYQRVRESVWRQTREGRANQRALDALRGRYAGRRCFIMGGGPSLNRTDIRLLKDEVTIASNGIFLIFDAMGYQPTFVTVEDWLVAEDRAARLNDIRGSIKLFPHDLAYCLRQDEETIYVNFVRQYDDFPRFSDDFAKIVYFGGTVSFLNLQLAYYLGCHPIYLIGFDHYYQVPKDLSSDTIVSRADDTNHFHPDYFGKGFRWHDPQVERMTSAYRAARAFLEPRGIHVFNATPGGHLEVFPRVEYSSIVEAV